MTQQRATRIQASVLIALAGAALAFLAWTVAADDAVPFLDPDEGPAAWVRVARPLRTQAFHVDRETLRPDRFVRRFRVEAVDGPWWVEARALRTLEVRLNGVRVGATAEGEGWREVRRWRVDAAAAPGENLLEVRVRNPRGPALLQLRLDAPGVRVETGPGWLAAAPDGPLRRVAPVRDGVRPPVVRRQPGLARWLRAHGAGLLGLAALGALLAWAGGRAPPAARRHAPAAALAAVGAFFALLFALRLRTIPRQWGFDVVAHLDYVRFLLEQGRLPLATEGWSMYHPPLHYLLSAGLLAASGTGLEEPASRAWLRVVPTLAAFGQAALALGLARVAFPGDARRAAWAVLLTGLLPMNVVLAAYPSNEGLHGALAGASILVTARLLAAPGLPGALLLLLGALLGLALLTKITTFLLVPLLLLLVLGKHLLADGAPLRRAAMRTALAPAMALAVCGAWFARNAVLLGSPVIGNWDLPGTTRVWWQDPGFHTPAYYASFGVAVGEPWYAGFASFWDGLYSTLWGDGLLGGLVLEHVKGGIDAVLEGGLGIWSYGWMALAYALALPATALLLGGLAHLAVRSLRGPDLRRRAVDTLLWTAPCALGFGILLMTLRLPFYAQTKAFYGLAVAAPLGLALAHALVGATDRLARGRAAFLAGALPAWAAVLLGTVVLAFLG